VVAAIEVRNGSSAWLGLWLEPLGEDRWLRPGETFRVWSDYIGDESAFSIDPWSDDRSREIGIENVNVWVLRGDCFTVKVTDATGALVECGHQRPAEVAQQWAASDEAARKRVAATQAQASRPS
jgi:hypothetical protein